MSMFGPAFDAQIAYEEERRADALAASGRSCTNGAPGLTGRRRRLLDLSPLAILIELFERRAHRRHGRGFVDAPNRAR
jgi:hypothetical protein